jgi:tetratricopeptide (TPR) repeat protein
MSQKNKKTSTTADDSSSTSASALDSSPDAARARLADIGRNDPCPCGAAKKYKKCHLQQDQAAASPPAAPPTAEELVAGGWRLFEQRRPGAAEKEFRAALALQENLPEARVGIGMARLQAGDNDGARSELSDVIKASDGLAADLRKEGVKDAFTRKEAQSYIRACHALGCLAYDQEKYDEALESLGRVYEVDEGTVGTEARLIAAKTLIKLDRAAEAIPVLEQAARSEGAAGRANLGLALAAFKTGDRARAQESLGQALESNPHYAKAILGLVRGRRVDNPVGAPPGSREEALVYAQTYGDVWDDPAKEWIEQVLAGEDAAAAPDSAGAASTPEESAASASQSPPPAG